MYRAVLRRGAQPPTDAPGEVIGYAAAPPADPGPVHGATARHTSQRSLHEQPSG